jgi:hypothetical protein
MEFLRADRSDQARGEIAAAEISSASAKLVTNLALRKPAPAKIRRPQ